MKELLDFTLTGLTLNRYEHERTDPKFVQQRLQPSSKPRVVIVAAKGPKVAFAPAAQRSNSQSWWHHSLSDGRAVIAAAEELIYVGEDPLTNENIFSTISTNVSGPILNAVEWGPDKDGIIHLLNRPNQAAYGLAVSLARWHAAHRHCPRCGGGTTAARDGGFSRFCQKCKRQHFPQIMPAVLVTVLDGKGNVILSQRRRNSKLLTVLSGFLLHGESAEEALRREVEEETGAKVSAVRYIGSQPWPYPYLLMLCYYAVAENSPRLVVEAQELEMVTWVSKADVRRALEGNHPNIELHGKGTTPYMMLKPWVDGEVDDYGRLAQQPSKM